MNLYKYNAKWLMCIAPFRDLSVSAAYLAPFFLQKGLSLSQIFLLQSVFSIALLAWELPSGWLADRKGRALCLKLSYPLDAAAIILYGFSGHFWQFIVLELVLAVANGLMSGIDAALLLDSLKADGREDEYVRLSQRMNALSFAATAVGVPVAVLLVHYVSIGATLVADGLLSGIGIFFVLKLVEAPRFNQSQEAVRLSAWHAMSKLSRNAEARWLVILTSTLSTATYLGFWMSASYYGELHIPIVLFGVILAVRSLWKAWLSHRFVHQHHLERNMVSYALLAGAVCIAMASGQLWLAWLVLGHDVVQALQGQPLTAKLNVHISHEYRATMNSLVNLVQRLAFSVAGPLVGLLVDRHGLSAGFLATGAVCSVMAFVAIARLHTFGTLRQER